MQETKHFDLNDLNEILDFIDQMQIKNVKIGGFDKEEVYYRMLELAQKCIDVAEKKLEEKLDMQAQPLTSHDQRDFAFNGDMRQQPPPPPNADMANELSRVQSLYASAQAEINDLQAQLQQRQNQVQDNQGYLGGGMMGSVSLEANADLKAEIQDLKMQLSQKQQQLDSYMQGAMQTNNAELAEVNAALKASQNEVRELRAMMKQKQDQINTLYAQSNEKTYDEQSEANYAAAQREIRDLKVALREKQEEIGAYERQGKYLREARDILKEAKSERNRLLHEAEMVAEQELLLAQAQARKKVASLSGDVDALERRKKDLEIQIKQAEQGMIDVCKNSQDMAKTLSQVYTRFAESSTTMGASPYPDQAQPGERVTRMQQRHDQRVVK